MIGMSLESLTDQEFGRNVEAWRTWRAAGGKARPPSEGRGPIKIKIEELEEPEEPTEEDDG